MDESTQTKVCTSCQEEKSLDDFHRRTGGPLGRVSHCKNCVSARAAARYSATVNDELRAKGAALARARRASMTEEQLADRRRKNREYMARALAEDPEKFRRRAAEFKRANPDRVAAARRAFYERHPGRKAEYDRAYRDSRAAELKVRKAEWYALNAERVKARVRQWAVENPDMAAELSRRRRARERGATIGPIDVDALWTGFCGICGEPMDPTLRRPDLLSRSIDHIIPLARGGSHSQDNLQWAHLVCNLRKGARLPD